MLGAISITSSFLNCSYHSMPEGFTSHPSHHQLEAFVRGELSPTDQQVFETHIEQCKACRDLLHTLPLDSKKDRSPLTTSTVDLPEGLKEIQKPETDALDIPVNLTDHPRYEIIKRLGIGGMGVVYQAQHRLMGRMVALKVINNRLLQNSEMVERFRFEIKAAARLSHRNIVTAFDAEQAGDVHFFVMEFVEGTDLSSIVSRRGQLLVTHACSYIMQAARGLQHAHEQGMVHRDIKPQNLMRTSKGVIKVLDFGLARLANPQDEENSLTGITAEGITLGTPDYIAPEQARDSRQADIRSDIYSLGCTFYYFLTGQVPFPTGTVMEKIIAHCESVPESIKHLRNDLPDSIVSIVQKMMAKNPSDRFQTPKEVSDALKPFAKKQAEVTMVRSNGNAPLTATIAAEMKDSPDVTRGVKPLSGSHTFPELEDHPPRQEPSQKESGGLIRYRNSAIAALLGVIVLVTVAIIFSGNNETGDGQATENQGDNKQQTDVIWIDLTNQINLAENAVEGEWRQNENELHVDALEWARLALPYAPPAEYDFEVQFTRQTGSQSIAFFFVHGTGQASFELDAWNIHLAGIQRINNRDIRSNPTRQTIQPLQNNQLHTVLIKVRRDNVETYLNGKRLNLHESDGADLTLSPNWSLGDTSTLGIGAYRSETIFHRVRVRPAS